MTNAKKIRSLMTVLLAGAQVLGTVMTSYAAQPAPEAVEAVTVPEVVEAVEVAEVAETVEAVEITEVAEPEAAKAVEVILPQEELETGEASYAARSGKWRRSGKRWWYRYTDGSYPRSTWESIKGKWYYFDDEGYMKTGWQKTGRKWYYLKSTGEMATGWVTSGGKRYYMDKKSGAMKTGWVKDDGKWYYLKTSGVMVKGWRKVGGKWYYLDSSGAMKTGWLEQGGKRYYLDSSGVMVTGRMMIDGSMQSFNASGVWTGEFRLPEREKLLDVTSYGAVPGDSKDDSKAIKAAIDSIAGDPGSAYEGVYIPSGTYKINIDSRYDGVWAKSGVAIVMEDDTILEAMPSAIDNYYVLCAKWCENVTIVGGQIIGDRNIHKGTGGEAGHGIFIAASNNVNIIGTKVSDCWGDGIYLGISSNGDQACDGVYIENCTLTNNRRNNISVVEAHNVTIDGCTISAAYGIAPQCGICIEPNRNAQGKFVPNRNVTIRNTTITQNRASVAQFDHYAVMAVDFDNNTDVAVDNLLIEGCTIKGDLANFSGKNATIRDTTVSGTLFYKYDTTMKNVNAGKITKW